MRWILCAFLLVGVLPAAETPDTPAGQVLARWLEAFNSGDRARLQDCLQVYAPKSLEKLDDVLEFRERTGGFHLISILKSAEFALEAVVKERDGDNYRAWILEVESVAPHRIVTMSVRVTAAPASASAVTRLGEKEAASAWQAELKRRAAEDSFAGAYLWARGGKTIATGALGLADRERKLPNALATQFRLGSMNKMFTAVAVLQLVEKGRLGMDDVIGKHLREYPNKDLAAKVTVRQLLTHSGGTGDIFTPEYERKRLELRTLQDYVALYGARELKFEPGTRWEYSNYGFILLGVLVERLSGENYYDYVRAHIFRPAGMRATDSLPESQRVASRAAGYTRQAGKWVSNADSLPWRGTSAGGGYSTAGDLHKFAAALLSHKLLGPALLTEATKVQQEKGGYGFGFGVENEGGVLRFGHGGGAPGMNGVLHVYPAGGDVIVVLSNLDPPAATRMADWLEQRLPVR